MRLSFSILILGLSLSACATHNDKSIVEGPHAKLNFVNENHLSPHTLFGFEQKYASVANQTCNTPVEMARFSKVSKDHEPVFVESGKQLNILAYNIYGSSHSINQTRLGQQSNDCKSVASFVPESGKNYIIRMKETARKACEIFVVDYESKIVPVDLAIKNQINCE